MHIIYILKLEQEKYYVGKTKDIIRRYSEHINGKKGSLWTKKYKPLIDNNIEIYITNNPRFKGMTVNEIENKITLETMKKYGVENVRGGKWCKLEIKIDQKLLM